MELPTVVLRLLRQQAQLCDHPAAWMDLARRVRAKPRHGQVFGVDRLVVADQPQRRLVRVIEPGRPHLTVQDRHPGRALARLAEPFARASQRLRVSMARVITRRWTSLSLTLSPAAWQASRSRRHR